MLRRLAVALAGAAMVSCTGEAVRKPQAVSADRVEVRPGPEAGATSYRIVSGDCQITWDVYQREMTRGVIRHRSDCGLPLQEQAPLIGELLAKVRASDPAGSDLRALDWGRLCPDGARDFTMSARLALAASRSGEWNAARGRPRDGDLNGWARDLAEEASIYREIKEVFRLSGLDLRLTSLEKVLVQEAAQLPLFETLRGSGVKARDKVPFDFQTWFSVRRADAEGGGK